MRKPHFYFWQGFVFHLGLIMGLQDWMGREKYLDIVAQNWWDLHWIIGASIAALSLGAHLLFRWALADYRENAGNPEK